MSLKSQAFTFLEILAVVALMAIVLGVAISSFRGGSNPIRRTAQSLTKDIQASYFQAIKRARVIQLRFSEKGDAYYIEYLNLHAKAPSKDDKKAYEAWEEKQKKKKEELDKLSPEERRNLSDLDLAEFVPIRKQNFPDGISLKSLSKINEEGVTTETKQKQLQRILFYPTGEMDSALVIIQDDGGRSFSLVTDSITGRVNVYSHSLTEEEWKKSLTTD